MFCAQCGQPVAEGAKFCGHCGSPVASTKAPAPEPAQPTASPGPAYSSGSAGADAAPPGSVPGGGVVMNRLIERVKNIIVKPTAEWPVIAEEATTARDVYLYYVAPLALIGIIATLIGQTLVGVNVALIGTVRIGLVAGLVGAILHFVLTFVMVFVIALIVDALAPTFGGQRDSLRALKVTAYSFTPAWVAGILALVPALGILGIIAGLYGLYILYLGLPVLMRSPQDKAIGYTIVVLLCAIALGVVIGVLSTCVVGGFGAAGLMGRSAATGATGSTDAAAGVVSKMFGGKTDADRERMKDAMSALEKIGAQADQAEKAARASGKNPDAAAANSVDMTAAMNAVGTVMAGGKQVEPVDFHRLKELLPESLPGGLKRVEAEGQGGEAMGIKGTSARGRYSDGANSQISVEIVDLGTLSGLAGLAARFDPTMEKETGDSYERTRTVDGQVVHEQYNKRSKSGEVSVIVGQRFSVTAQGDGVDPAALAGALKAVDLNKLAALRTAAK